MKKLGLFLMMVAFLFCFSSPVTAATLFWDSVLDGGYYTLDGSTRTMDLYVQTQYAPYDEDGNYLSGSGAGTILDWHFAAVFDSSYDLITDGSWEESWGTSYRIGLYDKAVYVRTGENDLGQNTGTFSAEWSTVDDGWPYDYLAPEGPWFALLDITRTEYGTVDGVYQSSGTVTGAVGNDRPAPVPEPSTVLLLGGGLFGLAWYGRKRNKA